MHLDQQSEETQKGPTSIWPGDGLTAYLRLLGPRPSRREGVSRVVDRQLARYLFMLKGALPEWPFEDWCFVVESLKKHEMGQVNGVAILGLVLQSAAEHKKSGLSAASGTHFAYQAKRLAPAQLVAVAEVVEAYWRRHEILDAEALRVLLSEIFEAPGIAQSAAPPSP